MPFANFARRIGSFKSGFLITAIEKSVGQAKRREKRSEESVYTRRGGLEVVFKGVQKYLVYESLKSG
jgi:hypothetical protein